MKSGVKAGDLRNRRLSFAENINHGKTLWHVERRQLRERAEAGPRLRIDHDRGLEGGPSVNDTVSDSADARYRQAEALDPIEAYTQHGVVILTSGDVWRRGVRRAASKGPRREASGAEPTNFETAQKIGAPRSTVAVG
jgi:hypothetical protein